MTERLTLARQAEVWNLLNAFEGAVQRIRYYRERHPAINERDCGRYLDGSTALDFGSTGFATSEYRMWDVGEIDGRRLLVYETSPVYDPHANDDRYRHRKKDSESDYGLAIQDLETPQYGGHRDGLNRIQIEGLDTNELYSIDHLILMTDALREFFASPAAFRREIELLKEEFVHNSASKLVLT